MKILLLSILILFVFQIRLAAQVSYGGKPYPFEPKKAKSETITMPPFSYSWVLEKLEADDRNARRKALPIAWNYDVKLNPANSGNWTEFSDGTNVWRLQLKSEDAYAISLFFDVFDIKHGARIFVYDPAMEQILGSFDHRSNKQSGNFPVSFITGDQMVVELQVDKGVEDFGQLNIGSVSHAFMDIFGNSEKNISQIGKSEACNVNINCPSGDNWQDVKRAVTRVIFKKLNEPNWEYLCTGTLINNTSLDQTPYYYTANHCIDQEYAAQTAVFYFNYESLECKGREIPVIQTTAGATLLSSSESLDFSLLHLEEEIPDEYNPYFAGWTLSNIPSPYSVCIHHPMGDVKKISTVENPVTAQPHIYPPSWFIPSMFWRVMRWSEGATAGGSSGSPLFNPDKHIVGSLTGGVSGCDNPVDDYFTRFHRNWNHFSDSGKQLKYWLDRTGTGLNSLDGLDSYFYPDTSKNIMEILDHFNELQSFKNLVISTGLENMLASDSYYTVFAPVNEAFESLPTVILESMSSVQVEKAERLVKGHILSHKLKSENFPEGSILNTISGNNLRINVIGNEVYVNYAQVLISDIIASNGVIHMINELLFQVNHDESVFIIFPNPADEQIWVTIKEGSMIGAVLNMYNAKGALMGNFKIEDEKLSRFDISSLPSGIYFIQIFLNQEITTKKLIISNTRLP